MTAQTAPLLALLISLFAVFFLFERQPTCVSCGGRGGHRPGCPDRH